MRLLKLLRVVLALCLAQYRSDTVRVGLCVTQAQMADDGSGRGRPATRHSARRGKRGSPEPDSQSQREGNRPRRRSTGSTVPFEGSLSVGRVVWFEEPIGGLVNIPLGMRISGAGHTFCFAVIYKPEAVKLERGRLPAGSKTWLHRQS